jgi:cytoskeletal protein CcmA (bactofilin family)
VIQLSGGLAYYEVSPLLLPEQSVATLGKSVQVIGRVTSSQDLYVNGDLDGAVEALNHTVTVGPEGTVRASIKARVVVVHGILVGNVEAADKMEISKDARLEGDVRTPSIVVEDGAYFKGSIDIIAKSRTEP